MGDERLRRNSRIRKGADYTRAIRRRCTASDGLLLVFGFLNETNCPRFGLSVSKKLGGAVVRNRWKRRLRDAFRLEQSRLPAGVDLIVIPRAESEPEFSSLCQSLVRLAGRVARKLGA